MRDEKRRKILAMLRINKLTADEITSLLIYSNNTNVISGTIRLSVPKNTKQNSPSFTVTVN